MERTSTPVQMCDWWLDAVCGDQWNVILTNDETAAYSYFIKTKKGARIVEHPALTTYAGFWAEKQNLEANQIDELIRKMPKPSMLIQKMHFQLGGVNLLQEKGFKQTSRYTHTVDLSKSIDDIFQSFKGSLKTDVKKASVELHVEETDDLELTYELISKSFKRQSLHTPFSFDLFKRLDQALNARNARKILIAVDQNKNSQACVYLSIYQGMTSYIIGGADPLYRNTNPQSLLLFEAIKLAKNSNCHCFDFTGSVMSGVEKFFTAFNAEKKLIPVIYQAKNRFFEMYMNWKNFV